MNSHHTISFLLILLLALSGCEQFTPNKKAYKENLNINITDIEFEPDYKRFHLNVEINDTLTALLLSSNADSIHFKTEEFLKDNSYNLIKTLHWKLTQLDFAVKLDKPPLLWNM